MKLKLCRIRISHHEQRIDFSRWGNVHRLVEGPGSSWGPITCMKNWCLGSRKGGGSMAFLAPSWTTMALMAPCGPCIVNSNPQRSTSFAVRASYTQGIEIHRPSASSDSNGPLETTHDLGGLPTTHKVRSYRHKVSKCRVGRPYDISEYQPISPPRLAARE